MFFKIDLRVKIQYLHAFFGVLVVIATCLNFFFLMQEFLIHLSDKTKGVKHCVKKFQQI